MLRLGPDVDFVHGYPDGAAMFSDYLERLEVAFDRLRRTRAALPEGPILSDRRRAEALEAIRGDLDEAAHRIRAIDARIADRARRSESLGVELPLVQLARRLQLSPLDVVLLATLALIERGAAFNGYDKAGVWSTGAQPQVSFLASLFADDDTTASAVRARFLPDAPLVRSGLVLLARDGDWLPDAPLAYKRLRLADRVLDFLEGEIDAPASLLGTAASFTQKPEPAGSLRLDDSPDIVQAVTRAVADLDQVALLLGPAGVGRRSIAGAAAHALGRPLLVIDLSKLPLVPEELDRALDGLLREALLRGALLVLAEVHAFADGEGQSALWPRLTGRLRRLPLPLALVGERPPNWLARVEPRLVIEFRVPFPSPALQRRLWNRYLPPHLTLAEGVSIDGLVRRFALSAGAIQEAAAELSRLDQVHQRGGVVDEKSLSDVVRRRLAHRLGNLATTVTTTLDWKDAILPDEVLDRVMEFLNYAMQRERVMSEWGFRKKLPYGRGLSALFSGPPGTGKTMICSLLARELGVDLYRIDLSQVVNKYIGETEKNLGRVFDEAGNGQVMLLFDEADSLFAKRTEVKSSHDRYANLEVNYLLQRIENFDGIVVLTTNSESAIDPAFRRRIRFRVRFPAADEKHREQLWRAMIPKDTRLAPGVDFAAIARKYALNGGNIMNAVVRAAISAAVDGDVITHEHLRRAAELEHAEMGFLS